MTIQPCDNTLSAVEHVNCGQFFDFIRGPATWGGTKSHVFAMLASMGWPTGKQVESSEDEYVAYFLWERVLGSRGLCVNKELLLASTS
jgi:hypothetical protein